MDETTGRHDPASAVPTPAVPAPHTERTRIRRHPERAVPERIEEFLQAGLVAHVAYVEDGEPYVIPFLYHSSPATCTCTARRGAAPSGCCETAGP